MTLHETIRELRKGANMTQEELAEAMGLSTASVSKWETGQSAPELSVLCALADYFEVSVDRLLGHTIQPDREKRMLDALNSLAREEKFDEAKELADTLLRNYPNSYPVVDAAARLHYQIQVVTGDAAAMETAIQLIQRLFPLAEGGEKARLALLGRLANCYELLGNWEMARKYYEEGNVSGSNDRPLAYLHAQEKGDAESICQISNQFTKSLFYLLTDVTTLKALWEAQGEPQRAMAALEWAVNTLDSCGAALRQIYAPMGVVLHLSLASMDSSLTENHIRQAAELVKGGFDSDAVDFLSPDIQLLASQELYDAAALTAMLRQMGWEQYIPIVEDVMK